MTRLSDLYIIRQNMSLRVAWREIRRENLVRDCFKGLLFDSRGVSDVSPSVKVHDLAWSARKASGACSST